MYCIEPYEIERDRFILQKVKERYSEEFIQIQTQFKESEAEFRPRLNEELYSILSEIVPAEKLEKYSGTMSIVSWGEKRKKIRERLEHLKDLVRQEFIHV